MKLNNKFLQALGAKVGAGSAVTADEFKKHQVTFVTDEKEVLFSKLPKNRIYRGKVASGGDKSQQTFILYQGATKIRVIHPNLIFPKPMKDELRLYLSEGEFHPAAGSLWYVFIRHDDQLCLGWCPPDELFEAGWLSPTVEISDDSALGENTIPAIDLVDRIEASILVRRGQSKFRRALRRRFANKCCISGSTTVAVLEAAHIAISVGKDNNAATNGLLLRSDLHTLFDLGLIAVDPDDLKVCIHPSLVGSDYEQYNGRTLLLNKQTINAVGLKARWAALDWTD